MTLSTVERRLLINQYEVLKRLDPCNIRHYDMLLSMLHSGYDSEFIELLTQWQKPPLSDEVRQEVRDVIDMFRTMGPPDGSPAPNFPGFSRLDETEHYEYAMFVLEKESDIFPAAMFDYDTHYRALPNYREMLKEWRASRDPENLTDDDVQRINAKASSGFPAEEQSRNRRLS